MDLTQGKIILDLEERIISNFNTTDWEKIGLLTGFNDEITHHPRLLRSLAWGDEDYGGNVIGILKIISQNDDKALLKIKNYLDKNYPEETHYISTRPSEKKITFAPNIFRIPDMPVDSDLVGVMMPIRTEFLHIYETIKQGCKNANFRCARADDIWNEEVIIQDIFNLIYRSKIIVVDFTGKNPNVMYEMGIAHTLGKEVIPITQSLDDIPFDISHLRVLKYLSNNEGLNILELKIAEKLRQINI